MKIEEKYKLEKYIKEDGSEVNVYFDIDRQTIWMNQKHLTILFKKDKSVINRNIKMLDSVVTNFENTGSIFATTALDGKTYEVEFYSMNLIDKLALKFEFEKYYDFKDWVVSIFEKSKRGLSKKYEIVEFNDENISLDVNVDYEHDTVWLNRRQIALLFNVSVDNVSFHIKNILACGELDNTSVYEDSSATGFDGKTYKIYMYNFDIILSIGYRVNSKRGILFRKWASSVLKKHSYNGYAINEKRCLDCQSV